MRKASKYAAFAFLIALLLGALCGCGSPSEPASAGPGAGQSDLAYVQSRGKLVVGITEFAPMDYREGDGWTGFDAELAEAFAKELGLTVSFVEINWSDKTRLLANGSIDCVWNGMTMTEELQREISCTDPYLSNAQVAVFRTRDMERYQTLEDCSHALFAVEDGSMGESLLKGLRYRYRTYATQMEALKGVHNRQTDAAVIDIVMAAYYIKTDSTFRDLDYRLHFSDETICVGFRAGSDLTEKANAFLRAAYEDGIMQALASRYSIENALLSDSD